MGNLWDQKGVRICIVAFFTRGGVRDLCSVLRDRGAWGRLSALLDDGERAIMLRRLCIKGVSRAAASSRSASAPCRTCVPCEYDTWNVAFQAFSRLPVCVVQERVN